MTQNHSIEEKLDIIIELLSKQKNNDNQQEEQLTKQIEIAQNQSNMLFQTIGIMLALFFPIFIDMLGNLSVVGYNLSAFSEWFFFGAFMISLLGFLIQLKKPVDFKEIRAWRQVFVMLPLMLVLIALGAISFVFMEIYDTNLDAQIYALNFVIGILIIFAIPLQRVFNHLLKSRTKKLSVSIANIIVGLLLSGIILLRIYWALIPSI